MKELRNFLRNGLIISCVWETKVLKTLEILKVSLNELNATSLNEWNVKIKNELMMVAIVNASFTTHFMLWFWF